MNESTTPTTKQFTGCASLAVIGMKLRELKLFEPIEQTVQIAQKTFKDRPTDKLYDALISMLAGAHGLVEIVLNQAAPLAPVFLDSLRELLTPVHVALNLNQT